MSKYKLTEWFGPIQKPLIPGVYQTTACDPIEMYQKWTGSWWGKWNLTPELAEDYGDEKSRAQNVQWRGLAERPNKKDKA